MAVEHIQNNFSEKVQIVEFNPWQIHGLEQLTEAFFHEIGPKLSTNKAEDGAKRKKSWEKYGNYIGAGLTISKTLRFGLSTFGVPFADIILKQGEEALDKMKDIAKQGEDAAGATIVNESLATLKEKLRAELQTLPHSVLVIIDDLDRLTADEVCHVLRLVKANADLPNFCFLLLCERTNVERALGSISNGRGEAFLEKIVQVAIDIPAPPIFKIHQHLLQNIDRIMQEVGIPEVEFDLERWANIWIPGISKYFTNLRHVDRFLNAFTISAAAFHTEGAYEVNPVDLIAVECLRLFEPQVLIEIRKSKHVLTTLEQAKDLSPALDEILKVAKSQPVVREIVEELFPNSHRVWQNTSYGGTHHIWKKQRRLCDVDFFERYFQLDVPEGQISESEIARILRSRTNREAIRDIFAELIQRKLIEPALMRLEANDELNDPGQAEPYLLALCDIADDLPVSNNLGLLGERSLKVLVRHALNRVLSKIADPDQKVILISKLVTESASLSMPAECVSRLISKTEGDSLFPVASDQVKDLLKDHFKKRITAAAESGHLLHHSELGALLYFWNECDATGVAHWVSENLRTPESGLVILDKLTRIVTRMGGYHSRKHRIVRRDTLERYAPLERWVEMVDLANDPAVLNSTQQESIRNFRTAQKRWQKEVSDDDWRYDEQQ